MVTTEQIDDDLVDRISGDIGQSAGPRRIVALTLAWLANNPIEPTLDQMESIWYKRPDITSTGSAIVEFQRIAYLCKEPKYPAELQELLVDLDLHDDLTIDRRRFNSDLKKAYELGHAQKDGAK